MDNGNTLEGRGGLVNVKAAVSVAVFVVYVTAIALLFQYGHTLLASYILILTVLSGILYALASKSNVPAEEAPNILEGGEIHHISGLLRYATAVLSFISLMTTAKGLQSFVFSEKEEWLAYLGSFAVQAVLVSFSLTYCHLFTGIRGIITLSERGKTLMNGALTVFLAVAFVVSSSFSFSYIANNAYKNSWPGDSEILIEKYLTQSIANLDKENERIGGLLYREIRTRGELLSGAAEEYIASSNEELAGKVDAFELWDYTLSDDGTDHGYGLTDAIIASWRTRYPRYAVEIDGLVGSFDAYVQDLRSYCADYNQIAADFKSSASGMDWEELNSYIEDVRTKLQLLSSGLGSLRSACTTLHTSAINNDISHARDRLAQAVGDFRTFVNMQGQKLDTLQAEVSAAASSYSTSTGSSLPDQIKMLQKKIYMLGSAHVSGTSGDLETEVKDIIEGLSDIVVTYLDDDILSGESVAGILTLEELVTEYRDYLELALQIENYLEENLGVTYRIVDADNPASPAAEEDSGSVVSVPYREWVSMRDGDFLQLFSLLKELPTEPVQGTEPVEDAEPKRSEAGDGSDAAAAYEAQDVLYEANILRRDLLGEITEFERAFNYFKYDFKLMAFFSAGIAVFFDLGAFLTGCFLYGMKHFRSRRV